MQPTLFQGKYSIVVHTMPKQSLASETIDSLCEYFCQQIDLHPVATYIDTFDHYAHTSSLENGQISSDIKDARIVLFCFGKMLNNPQVLSVRPRAIGICETETDYVISFLEVPNEALHQTMVNWVKNVSQDQVILSRIEKNVIKGTN